MVEKSLYIYKNSDPREANDTFVIFLENWDIRIDWSEYGESIHEYQWHDDDIAFSIHKEDFQKLIEGIKKKKPRLKVGKFTPDEDIWEITDEQKEIYTRLKAAFSEEVAYRFINDFCHDIWINGYDYEVYF